jgi:hypothetical protein
MWCDAYHYGSAHLSCSHQHIDCRIAHVSTFTLFVTLFTPHSHTFSLLTLSPVQRLADAS